jgi:hypothetical protein
MRNIFCLYEEYNCQGLDYLLTFKLSQDFLETFFCAVRARGDFNNNPNVLQFQSAYKRLLIRHEIREFYISLQKNSISLSIDGRRRTSGFAI